jgi:hypothetical protein
VPVVIRMGVTPIPVIVLFAFLCFRKVVILFMMFLEVPPVRLILIPIPFVGILVNLIFVAPALLVVLAFVRVVTVLSADRYWNNQGRTQQDHFEIAVHDVLLPELFCKTVAILCGRGAQKMLRLCNRMRQIDPAVLNVARERLVEMKTAAQPRSWAPVRPAMTFHLPLPCPTGKSGDSPACRECGFQILASP